MSRGAMQILGRPRHHRPGIELGDRGRKQAKFSFRPSPEGFVCIIVLQSLPSVGGRIPK
jgi:hypothetical protein